jgi:sensor histidine kinase YesM
MSRLSKLSLWRSFVVVLAASFVGTFIAKGIMRDVEWYDAAAFSTFFVTVMLVFMRQLAFSGKQTNTTLLFMSVFKAIDPGCLSAEDRADAAELNRSLKRNLWRWIAIFLLMAAAGGVLIRMIVPSLGWREAFTLAVGGCSYLLIVVLSPWYSYRKWTRSSTLKTFFLLFLLTVVAALAGIAAPNARPFTAVDPDKAMRAIGIALVIALVLTSLIVGISRMRLREADQRAARLAAEAEGERLARQNVQAELKLLQAQVEPHFLFNTLANVRHLMQTQNPQALAMLDHLIHYLRTALPEMRGESSTLGREVELARAYLEIMRLRMGGALVIAIDLPQALVPAPFPPLMLMTLVENAIKHGVAPAAGGRVAIRARAADGKMRVTVEDDGAGLGGTLGSGVGLANLRERLAALFGPAARLDLESHEGGGTRASIEVPAT